MMHFRYMTTQRFLILVLFGCALGACSPLATADQSVPEASEGRAEYDPDARFISQNQAPGAYFIAVPTDVDAYRERMTAYALGDNGGLPLEAVNWTALALREEPNRAIARHAAQQAGEHVSPLGTVVEMEEKEGVFTVRLQAHVEGNVAEIAIAEPPVKQTLLAFDFVHKVEFLR